MKDDGWELPEWVLIPFAPPMPLRQTHKLHTCFLTYLILPEYLVSKLWWT